jgi:RNA polymerase sigma factor (sigma-70 family)
MKRKIVDLHNEGISKSPLPLISELPSLAVVEKDIDGFARSFLRVAVENVLDSLTLREKRAIISRYFYGLTYREIAREFNVKSKERVRQICVKALRKLRHPSRSNLLRPFANGYPDTQVFDERRFWRIGKSVMPKKVRKSR